VGDELYESFALFTIGSLIGLLIAVLVLPL